MLRWQIAIQDYRGYVTSIYKDSESHTYSYCQSRCPLDNVKSNPAFDPEVAANISIHFIEVYRKKNFRFSEWAPGSGTSDTNQSGPEETETPISGISSSELQNGFFNSVTKSHSKHK
ncbi:hypothetical protein O181_025479 [Austropuccinia psidii MF-1]|uniref:Uncharacterized protein n=1 Tax=Austropuccinia psidii MF-1 TaxID=1389203 RepID=A0A9Q3CKM4_9BASI|nr:hypothetical protein [Austropuccinia psidii MF-1]